MAGDSAENEEILDGLRQEQRYRLLGKLGEGSLGRVDRVYDAHLARVVAAKTLHAKHLGETNALRSFVNEARILGRLDQAAIIPIFDAGLTPDGLPAYTMREISGRSLAQHLEMDKRTANVVPLPLERTLKIITLLCEALGHAHERGIVHLDLKPQNVIVLPYDEVILVDWGAATVYDEDRFSESLGAELFDEFGEFDPRLVQSDEFIVGTPRYMSPEQTECARSTLTPASDVFSAGILFYQMLTGRLPFQGESLEELLFHIRETEAPDPRKVAPGVHARLASLVLEMLAKDPDDRPYDMDAVISELEAFRGSAGEFPLRHFAKGELIIREGEEAPLSFVLVEGEVEIWSGEGESRRVLGRALAGDTFGELGVLRDGPRSASATALSDVVVREIDRASLLAETERLSPWVLAMLEGVVDRFVDRSERLVELMQNDDD
ncbi:MAG: cyclic nucleotide-binding domain-containing protein [bacterium]|nr:cyclic nucleotide-binding domain-containing protein [bacterium]